MKDRCRCFYLDDSLVIGNSRMECKHNMERTWELLVELGFVINTQKSSCSPSKNFVPWLHLNLGNMSILLPIEKVKMIINLGKDTLEQNL